jgi:chromatin assembly factor 1 subunit A
MEPPRKPLDSLKSTNANLTCPGNKPVKMFGTPNPTCPYLSHTQGSHQQDSSFKPPKKLVSAEDMPAFRQAVAGSELSKIGLIEVLNKQFPKISKATIKATLECIAVRRGHKEAEKRWVVIDD